MTATTASSLSASTCYEHYVSYGETDAMGVLYYAEYLHIFERARGLAIRSRGMSYNEVEDRGIYLPVREAGVRYMRPARYDDCLQVCTTISQWKKASLVFSYEIYTPDEVLMTTGHTHHACTNAKGRPTAVPDWLREVFAGI